MIQNPKFGKMYAPAENQNMESFFKELFSCFATHSQNLDDKVVFLINVLKEKNLGIEALKRKNVLLKSKVNCLTL